MVRPDGDSYAEGGVRDCQMPGQYVSIEPRATYVVERSVLRRDPSRDRAATLQIGMLVFHRTVDDPSPLMIDLAWQGPLSPE
jgi:hypothetical protein